ncbi:MAG TPA: Stk1 family PASTA domain-containing Ser/Thr kinase, partial [Mycobacteriales bacterium]|nr:Stk1 family PASTA domain-containing Ser/Thr kinase [Mycobacteriales bacterium]
TRLDRTVAVKIMRPALAEDPDFVARFTREARAAARLSSPDVVAVHDQGTDAATGTAYLVMEYVAGRTLRDLVRERGPLPPERALAVMEPVLRALGAAHAAGLVHRDVKPENVLLADDGSVKVADFGLARAVEATHLTVTTGLLIGTVAYLAPEQVEHGTADARTDLYAAGITLWELLTGVPPYSSDSPLSVAYRHVHEDVPPPSTRVPGLPLAVDDLVVRATRRDPDARHPDAQAFLTELRAVAAGLAGGPLLAEPAQPTLVVPRPQPLAESGRQPRTLRQRKARSRTPGRRRGPILLALVIALALIASVGGWYLGSGRYTSAPGVLDLPQAQAQAQLLAAGFDSSVSAEQIFDENVPVGHVAEQDPAPGGRIRKGGEVTLVLSRGPDRRLVPQLAGLTQAAAVAALEAVGLTLGKVTQEFSGAAIGIVIRSGPVMGQRLRPGEAVALVVSKGVEQLPVPDVTGRSAGSATTALRKAGFAVATVEVFDETVPSGRVVGQTPNGGRAPRGSTVTLRVSKGPELIAIPDLRGQPRDTAVATLDRLGLRSRIDSLPFGPGTVRGSDPPPGRQVRRGTVVTLFVF